ncbi:MAG: hypothetical protein HYV01_11430 [Deltaproteobacteria bacterium]|nr:hypothetical protein [Deltaproteobacteria bacterium]
MFTAILLLSLTVVPSLSRGAEDPWNFLDSFTPVPRSLTRIGEHYVAMLFVNREQRLFAAVIFNASCDAGRCELHQRASYAVANAEGSNTRLYVEPRETELMALIGAIYAQNSRRSG